MSWVQSNIRTWWLALALAAILFRGLIPVGYMPDFGAHRGGLMSLRICTGDGSAIIKVSADKYGLPGKIAPANHSDHHSNTPCDYAIGHVFNFVDGYTALLIFVAFTLLALSALSAFSFPLRRHFGDMAARAPPLFS